MLVADVFNRMKIKPIPNIERSIPPSYGYCANEELYIWDGDEGAERERKNSEGNFKNDNL
jgi:hypothetical protein